MRIVPGLITIILILIGLELFALNTTLNAAILPAPSRVFAAFSDFQFLKLALDEGLVTLSRAILGFFIAAITAIPMGLLVGTYKVLDRLFSPLIELLRPIPSSALIPVSILFLGLGTNMILFIVCFGSFWPILLNTIYGGRGVTERHNDLVKILDLTTLNRFLFVIFPTAVPSIFAGLRISISISLILAVTAEMLAGQNGLGFILLDYERAFRYSQMYAIIVVLAFIGLLVNIVLVALQRALNRRFPSLKY